MASGAAPNITTGGSNLPARVLFHGVEGVGKTSFAAFARAPIFGMTRGETGLLTLIDHGLVPATPHFDEFPTWEKLLQAVEWLTVAKHDFRTFALDTLNGAALLCMRSVCDAKFRGEWTKFLAYGKGPDTAQPEWGNFLAALDVLREKRGVQLVALCHTKIKPFNNPIGDNFDRYTPDLHEKLWGLAAKWADVILFANFEVIARKESEGERAKGVGGQKRVIHTVRTAAWDAKNRVGLPNAIRIDGGGKAAWEAFAAAMRHEAPAARPAKGAPAVSTTATPAVARDRRSPSTNGVPHAPAVPAGTAVIPATVAPTPAPSPPTPPPSGVPSTNRTLAFPPAAVAPPTAGQPPGPTGMIRGEQLAHLAELRKLLFDLSLPGASDEKLAETWREIIGRRMNEATGHCAKSARELTARQAEELIAKLSHRVNVLALNSNPHGQILNAKDQAEADAAKDRLAETTPIKPPPAPPVLEAPAACPF